MKGNQSDVKVQKLCIYVISQRIQYLYCTNLVFKKNALCECGNIIPYVFILVSLTKGSCEMYTSFFEFESMSTNHSRRVEEVPLPSHMMPLYWNGSLRSSTLNVYDFVSPYHLAF